MELNNRYFPGIEVIERGELTANLAPIVLGKYVSKEALSDYVEVLRVLCQGRDVKSVANDLKVDRTIPEVSPYVIRFGKLTQILPIGIVNHFGERLSCVGWIPVSEEAGKNRNLGKGELGFRLHQYDDNGCGTKSEIKNFIQVPNEEKADFMRFWLYPYISEGFEFLPKKWYGFFEYRFGCFRKKQNFDTVDHVDSAQVNAEFSVGKNRFYASGFKFRFKRRFLEGDRILEFSNGYSSVKENDLVAGLEVKSSGHEKISETTLRRLGKAGFKDQVRYEDLVAAETFPNLDLKKFRLKEDESLANLLTIFEEGDFSRLDGFDWVKF